MPQVICVLFSIWLQTLPVSHTRFLHTPSTTYSKTIITARPRNKTSIITRIWGIFEILPRSSLTVLLWNAMRLALSCGLVRLFFCMDDLCFSRLCGFLSGDQTDIPVLTNTEFIIARSATAMVSVIEPPRPLGSALFTVEDFLIVSL